MRIDRTEIPDVWILAPTRHGDGRGFFSETYNEAVLRKAGFAKPFVQDNHAASAAAGTMRGLHYQEPPFAQDKLVRVSRGRILDVAVDIRQSSRTYGKHVAVELSAENWLQLLVPAGFAHGYLTLEPDTEVLYKVTAYYAPAADHGIAWNDPDLGINWPLDGAPVLSARDERQPRLRDVESPFV